MANIYEAPNRFSHPPPGTDELYRSVKDIIYAIDWAADTDKYASELVGNGEVELANTLFDDTNASRMRIIQLLGHKFAGDLFC